MAQLAEGVQDGDERRGGHFGRLRVTDAWKQALTDRMCASWLFNEGVQDGDERRDGQLGCLRARRKEWVARDG